MRNMSLIDIAGNLLMLSGAMHLIAFALGGFSYGIFGLAPIGVLFLVLGYLLKQTESRLIAYIVYLGVGIGASFVLREIFVSVTTPNWWYVLMLITDAAAVVALFWFLWRAPVRAEA